MFDQNKLKELQNKSHVRGKLNKEFFSAQQEQLERKRRQMKNILDQQVEERKRQKERQRLEHQRKLQLEEDKIKAYYTQIEEREKKSNNPNSLGPSNLQNSKAAYKNSKSNGSGVYESKVVHQENNSQSYQSKQINNQLGVLRSKSRAYQQVDYGDIPVMPLMQSPEKERSFEKINQTLQGNSPQQLVDSRMPHRSSAGNIPLLQLTQDEKKEKKKSKRNPAKKEEKEKVKQKQRKLTFADEENTHANPRQQTQFKQIFGELNQELEEENKELKKQLKKKEQAISLLMGAVRSNAKLDKYRVQAQRILHGQNSIDPKIMPVTQVQQRGRKQSTTNNSQEDEDLKKESMFPKLKLHHQSMMHDYMFGSARRAQVLKAKTFK